MKLSNIVLAVFAVVAMLANGALAETVNYKATLPITPEQRPSIVSSLNSKLSASP
jgi:hypothetical protein